MHCDVLRLCNCSLKARNPRRRSLAHDMNIRASVNSENTCINLSSITCFLYSDGLVHSTMGESCPGPKQSTKDCFGARTTAPNRQLTDSWETEYCLYPHRWPGPTLGLVRVHAPSSETSSRTGYFLQASFLYSCALLPVSSVTLDWENGTQYKCDRCESAVYVPPCNLKGRVYW